MQMSLPVAFWITRQNSLFKYFNVSFVSISHLSMDVTSILSKENQERCIHKLKSIKPIRIQSKRNHLKKAAILVPLCMDNGELSLIYTLRSLSLKNHGGQVSFPGGRQDKSDNSLEETAVRETCEELGIDGANISIWGNGNVIGTRTQDMEIIPFIGYLGILNILELNINPTEVESVFTISLMTLCDPYYFKQTQFRNGYVLPVFTSGDHKVWGLTAIITHVVMSALVPQHYKNKLGYIHPYIK